MLYFFHGRQAVVISHGITKQESAVPPIEIERARQAEASLRGRPAAAHPHGDPMSASTPHHLRRPRDPGPPPLPGPAGAPPRARRGHAQRPDRAGDLCAAHQGGPHAEAARRAGRHHRLGDLAARGCRLRRALAQDAPADQRGAQPTARDPLRPAARAAEDGVAVHGPVDFFDQARAAVVCGRGLWRAGAQVNMNALRRRSPLPWAAAA